MRLKKTTMFFTVFMIIFITIPMGAFAGFYWEMEQTNENMNLPGMPQGTFPLKMYYTDHASRVETPTSIVIMDLQKKAMFNINPEQKNYVRTSFSDLVPPKPASGSKEETFYNQMQDMMKLKITPTGEKAKISGYDCQKFLVENQMMKSEYWVTKDIPHYKEIHKLTTSFNEKVFGDNPMMKQMGVTRLVSELDGFPVKTVSDMMGGKQTTILKSIEKKSLDDDLFVVPKGYTKRKQQPMPPGGMKMPGMFK